MLWHIPVSHYNEKVRWALDYKGVDHERRAPAPGAHMAVALALTRGRAKTFPILRLDGPPVADSTAIIAALEAHRPEPPLIPSDPGDRRRALALEEFFDEELGPHMRLWAWNVLAKDPERFGRLTAQSMPGPLRRAQGLAGRGASLFLRLRYGIEDSEKLATARERTAAAMDRLEAELGERDYLVGDSFSVADLTAAALFYPLVLPPEGPRVVSEPTPEWDRIRDAYRERRGFRWVEEMFARHRERRR